MIQLTSKLFCICITFLLSAVAAKAQDCEGLKNGTFYSYPKNSAKSYLIKRNGDYQYEKDIGNGDSIVYKIEWLNNCKYSLKFISTNVKLTDEESAFWEKHNLLYEITGSTSNYYTYKGYLDKSSNLTIQLDTMWLTQKSNIASNELIEPIKNEMVLKKAHFTDTSNYAVLYLYRTGKFAASQVDMITYFDNNLICDSKNGSSFIFKIFKEGNFDLSSVSNMNKKSAVLPLDIKFGHKYYVNSSARFTVNMLSVYIPILKLVDTDKGAEEFQNAY
jgi:hypothetical protein